MTKPAGCTVRTKLWRNGTLEAEDFPLADLSEYLAQDDCLVWADILCPDDETLSALGNELDLDQHAIEDAVAEQHERPKATHYASHTFLSTYALHLHEGEIEKTRVSAFAKKHGLVTVRLDAHFDMAETERRWDENADLLKFGPRALIHGLLDVIVDGYFDAIGELDDAMEALEDQLFEDSRSAANGVQRETFRLRKALVSARRVVTPMREVVLTVKRSATDDGARNPELVPYFEDLYDHTLRAAEWTESLRDLISSVFETTLSLSDVRMNTVMKKLTSWAAIIAVPTAITGWYGQNVPYPGFGDAWGYWASLAAISVIAVGLYILFKRKDWL